MFAKRTLGILLALALLCVAVMPVYATENNQTKIAAVWEETDFPDWDEGENWNNDGWSDGKLEQDIWVYETSFSKKLVKGKQFPLQVGFWGGDVLLYESSNPKVLTVSQDGIVTMKGKGTATITLTAPETEVYEQTVEQVQVTLTDHPLTLNPSASYQKSKYYTALNKIKFTNNDAKDVIAVAKSQVGYHEGKNENSLGGSGSSTKDYTEYGHYAGLNPTGWCSLFVNWVAREADIGEEVIPWVSSTASLQRFFQQPDQNYASWAKVKKKSVQPKAGDIVFYSSSKNGSVSHMGFVVSASYTDKKVKITTIEGNYSNKVVKRTVTLSRSGSGKSGSLYLLGIGCPKY